MDTTFRGCHRRTGEARAVMNPLITLAAPQDSSPLTAPVRPMQAKVLPELMPVDPNAYAECSAHLHSGSRRGIADLFDGVLGFSVAEVSLATATPDWRSLLPSSPLTRAFGDEIHGVHLRAIHRPRRSPPGTGRRTPAPPRAPDPLPPGTHTTKIGIGHADHDPAQDHLGSHGLKRGSDGD